jgi:hypothetical protein
MQDNNTMSIQKFISFFKNKFDIFKNKLLPNPSPRSTTISVVNSATISAIETHKNINTLKHNNNNPIYTTSVNIKHNNNIDSSGTKMHHDTITVTTTTTTTITTTSNTQPFMVNYKYINTNKNTNANTNAIDYSKYTDTIVSSLIYNMIDDVEIKHYLSANKPKKYLQTIFDFYDKQREYSYLQDILTPHVYSEFEQIVDNILLPDPAYLRKLHQLKKYSGDLVDINTRYGVFETNNFIIKIDDQYDIFTPELELMSRMGHGVIPIYNIVLPYFVHIVTQNKKKPTKNMHFSIQPRIKNTLCLRKWINLSCNRFYTINYYIKMCITISKSILFMHSHNIVHGDVKPDNILIDLSTHTPYIIDFGLSGLHNLSQGTGGTQPFCCPETENCSFTKSDMYAWTTNKKQYDLWSIAFIFSSIIIFKNSYNYYLDYPLTYFTRDFYINMSFLQRIPIQFREPFILVLSKKSDIDLSNFIKLLEYSLTRTPEQ